MSTETETERQALRALRALAANIKKPSRAAAFVLVRGLADELAGTEHHDALALLYRFFLPPVPKRAKTTLEWLAQAIDPKDDREYLRLIHVFERGGLVAVATDGGRLHIARDHGFKSAGFYNSAGDEIAYKGWHSLEGVMADYLDSDGGPSQRIKTSDVERTHKPHEPDSTARLPDGTLLNARHLDNALAGAEEFSVCRGHRGTVRLADLPFGIAFIMPLAE